MSSTDLSSSNAESETNAAVGFDPTSPEPASPVADATATALAPKLYAPDARAQEILAFVVMLASLFGGRTWKTIAALASSALNGTLPEAALTDLEALIAKHGLRL